MQFVFGKQDCQNIRRSLRQEWLETNGLGDYASSTLVGCNTRKYHGLLVADIMDPPGRHVLLSTLEESFIVGGRECFFSCRRHPGIYYPRGHEYLQKAEIGPWVEQHYRFGDIRMHRSLMMIPGRRLLLLRYKLLSLPETPFARPPVLRVKPLLAFRSMHSLTHANLDLQVKTWPAVSGFTVRPYNILPPLFMQVAGKFVFHPSPDWYRNVEYMVEEERGFPYSEDLFQPGILDIEMPPDKPLFLVASTEQIDSPDDELEAMWNAEAARRLAAAARFENVSPSALRPGSLAAALSCEARRFTVRDAAGQASVVAGYHWFGAWGRDTCISVPGLTFFAGRKQEGLSILLRMGQSARNGLIPNVFAPDGRHAYNCVDASLWYIWALQMMDKTMPEAELLLREQCWPVIKEIIRAYASGTVPHVREDAEGFLHVGDATTQLTWMDANVRGRPVTPRYGCPVEINALWYNALAFARTLARRYEESGWDCLDKLNRMQEEFRKRFWVERGRYLADVWRPDGQDRALRPNQLFAVSLPYAILDEEDRHAVVETVRTSLLTPFGLRTLWPGDPQYCPVYTGGPEQRDAAYHQGTVWPWLLGAYTDAVLRTAWDVDGAAARLLETVTPLFSEHLSEAGIGTISEIFDGDPPHTPNGCIAQAWSIAEVLRMLEMLRQASPAVYAAWEGNLMRGMTMDEQFPSRPLPVSSDAENMQDVFAWAPSFASEDAGVKNKDGGSKRASRRKRA